MPTNTYQMVANGAGLQGTAPSRVYTFTGDQYQPFGTLQVIEGTGLSRADPKRRVAVKHLPSRSTATPNDFDDFDDLCEDVNAGGTLAFTIVCDASTNNIIDF